MIVVEHEYKGTPPDTNITVEGVEYVMAKAGKVTDNKYTVEYRTKKAIDIKKQKEEEANEALREDIASRGGYKTRHNEKPYKEYNKKVLSGRHIKLVSEDYPSVIERTKKQQHRLNLARYKSDEAFFWACIIDQMCPDEQRTIDVLYKSYFRSSVGGVSRPLCKNVHSEYPTGERRAKYVSYDTSKESYSVQRRINGKNIKYLTVKDYQTAINKAQELFPEDFCYY
ncbi:hypothetical protein ACU41F_003125 [Klebsiella aerogenes]